MMNIKIDNSKKNPYSLMFGKEPFQMISRSSLQNEIIDMFVSEPVTDQIAIITGVRGSGKTVLMTSISRQIEAQPNWTVVELNPETNMLETLISRLCAQKRIAEWFKSAKLNLSFLGVSIEAEAAPPVADPETALIKIFQTLKKHGMKVLITIDEVINNRDIKVFSHTFQILVRKELPVFLLLTGLYENINNLQNEKSLTFLYRAPKIKMKPLNIARIADNYKNSFQIDEGEALKMAKETKGYPFAFQVLGYLVWKNRAFNKEIIEEYIQYLEEYAYEKIWFELSNKDKEITIGIARSKEGKVQEIQDILGMQHNQFTPYRKRLIQKGIVINDSYGYVNFTLPKFKEFVIRNYVPVI